MSSPSNSEQTTRSGHPKGAVNIALWVLQAALALYMVVEHAIPKLLGLGTSVEMFDAIGLGQWFRYVVGTLELLGSIALLIPRLTALAALGLTGVMVGATFTNLFVIPGGIWALVTAVMGVLYLVIAIARRGEITDLLAKIKS